MEQMVRWEDWIQNMEDAAAVAVMAEEQYLMPEGTLFEHSVWEDLRRRPVRMAELHGMYRERFIIPGSMQNAKEGKLELRRKQHLINMLMDPEAVEEWYEGNPLLVQQQYELVRQLQLCIGGHMWEDEQVDCVRQRTDKNGTPVMMVERSSRGDDLNRTITGYVQGQVSEKAHRYTNRTSLFIAAVQRAAVGSRGRWFRERDQTYDRG